MKKIIFFIFILFFGTGLNAQNNFTRQDTLRGSITKERAWWDLIHYSLNVKVDDKNKYISGSNTVKYKVLENYSILQIDLQKPLKITKVTQNGKELGFRKEGNAHFINLEEKQIIGKIYNVTIYYEGNPVESLRPPWSGGFTWNKDDQSNSFIATSNQGIGASIWWPCKDHMYDEPDEGVLIAITAPKGLIDVSNGRLEKIIENSDGTKTFYWRVINPINNYGINVNIGDYVHFFEKYKGLNGDLDCDYYVLSYNLEKAKKQFKQVPKMLEAFEHWFGPYPFYEDGFKLVQAPYLGMEHQSSVTYGNGFQNGYLGKDLSGSGWGLKFDFIIIHESGHEWFANNITNKDVADLWIHEGFTAYSETIYLDYHFGTKAGNEYVQGTRKHIKNDKPIIGVYHVNKSGSGDMYYKGASMIHTIRQMVDDDEIFRQILIGMNKKFYHQTVTTQQIENYISKMTNIDLSLFFDQYLRDIRIPILEYKIENSKIKYRLNNVVEGLEMPLKGVINGNDKWINASQDWKNLDIESAGKEFQIDPNFYVNVSEIQ